MNNETTAFNELVKTIGQLRGPNGCPWDKEQTHESLKRFLVEEVYEVIEAIRSGDDEKLKEELGDLLLQIVLQAQIATDNGSFNINDVAYGINKKMVERHPHVFKHNNSISVDEVLTQWEDLKPKSQNILGDLPKDLPALLKALKISQKAVSYGFEWENIDQIWQQLFSEIDEFKAELAEFKNTKRANNSKAHKKMEMELGDILFTIVNIARYNNIDPEEALHLMCDKFIRRFTAMEKLANINLKDLTIDQWNDLWQKAKSVTG